jgi:hypothetical protein
MNRTVKNATVKAFHYDNLETLKAHVLAFVTTYNFAKHLKPCDGARPSRQYAMRGQKIRQSLRSNCTTSSRDQTGVLCWR